MDLTNKMTYLYIKKDNKNVDNLAPIVPKSDNDPLGLNVEYPRGSGSLNQFDSCAGVRNTYPFPMEIRVSSFGIKSVRN